MIKKMKLILAEDDELREAIPFYLRAFEAKETSRTDELVNFWRLLIDGGICHFILAEYKKEIIGSGALVCYPSIAWVGWMAVDPEYQRKGIGYEIMKHLMGYAQGKGKKTLKLDATNYGKLLYSKFGFKDEYRVARYEINPTSDSDDTKAMDIKVSDYFPKWCLDLDKEAFGDDRGTFLKLLLKDGGKVILAEKKGFGLLRKNNIGPLIAKDLKTANSIVKYASKLGGERLYIPLHEDLPRKFLSDMNEKIRDSSITCCTRMTLGKKITEDRRKVFASFGAATG